MTTHGASPAQTAAWNKERSVGPPTVGWFVRRSALWASIVIIAVVSACALYAIASGVGTDNVHAAPKVSTHPLKV
jgi:hypothetical protein